VTLLEALTLKQRRSIRHDINLIISTKGIAFPKTFDELKEIGELSPTIKVNGKTVYFSNNGQKSLRRICSFVSQTPKYIRDLSFSDISQVVICEIERWFNDSLIPDEAEFIEPLDRLLENKIDTFTFFCRVEGLTLDGVNSIVIGNKEIRSYQPEMLSMLNHAPEDLRKHIDKEYGNTLVMIGNERGSYSVASEKFYYNSERTLSVLRLYSCAFYKFAIYRIKIGLINEFSSASSAAITVGWSNLNKDLIYTRNFKQEQDLKLEADFLSKLTQFYFFAELGKLIEKQNRTEIEEAIVKSIYWIGEAQKDRTAVSAWVKLWTCVECFFTLDGEKISEANAKGISSLLVYGGYKIKQYSNYEEVKRKVKNYYALRSKALHRAEYSHVDIKQLEEFSLMVAWVIIVMLSLLKKGFESLSQVQLQATKLDQIKKLI